VLGVELMPCQMTMDMFGLTRDDMIDGLGEPVGAATVVELLANGGTPVHLIQTSRREHAMTAILQVETVTRTVDARGSFCPGPLMELIRAIRESQVGDVIAVQSTDKGSKLD